MLAVKELNPNGVILVYPSYKIFSKKKSIIGKVNATVKNILPMLFAMKIRLKYFANPSIMEA